ncbi:hypothetical protein FACS1894217_00240 [Clostridia bacterium]|nr:hypothetical protein FACS1894217_00240 [Clostridia bacterium]
MLFMLPTPVLLLDPETNKVLYVNRSFCEMMEAESVEELRAHEYSHFIPSRDAAEARDRVTRSAKLLREINSRTEWDSQYLTLKGRVVDVAVSGAFVTYNEREAVAVIIRDVSAEKQQQRLLEKVAQDERESNKVKSRFLVNMSHEIRTPMNAVIGLSELALRRENLDIGAAIDTLIKVCGSAKILLGIINDILDFSKMEADKMDMLSEEFDLSDVIDNVLLVSSTRLGDKPVEMIADVADDVPTHLVGDRTRLWQILKNFLDNASKFTADGTIICRITAGETTPDGRVPLTFVVEDSGIGMSEDALRRLFTPFEQFSGSSKTEAMGTGLGMSIAKQLIELMGGSVRVESALKKGTTITFDIPFKAPAKRILFRDVFATNRITDVRALVAESSGAFGELVCGLLTRLGVDFTKVADVRQAANAVIVAQNIGRPFDIILLDNDKTGEAIARGLKEIHKDEKILLMAASYSKHLAGDAVREAGFSDVIEKPFGPLAFREKILRALGREAETHALYAEEIISFPDSKILLCEDNVINQEVGLGILEEFGIDTMVAGDGEVALEMLDKYPFDLVLMDIHMPVMDGLQATAAIRESGKSYAQIPIVAMTADVMQEEVKTFTDAGMDGHVAKPIEFERLQVVLTEFLTKGGDTNVVLEDDSFPQLYCVDIQRAVRHFLESRDDYIDALKSFVSMFPSFFLPFEMLAAEDNMRDAQDLAHEIVAAAANIGAEEVRRLALEFDGQLRLNTPNIVTYQELNQAMQELKSEVRQHFK